MMVCQRERRQVEFGAHAVDRDLEVRRGIEHGAVEVEDGGAHAAPLDPFGGIHARASCAAHGVDHGLVVGLAENRRAGDEGVGPGFGRRRDVVDLDAAVHFEQDLASRLVDALAHCGDFLQRLRNERLAAKAGIDRHDQDQVELVHHIVQIIQRRRRVEHQPGLAAVVADQLQRAVDVFRALRMKADDVGAGLGEIRDDAVDRLHHQMDVDRHLHVRPDRFADQRPDRQIRDIMVVHHIEVDEVGAGGDDVAALLRRVWRNRRTGCWGRCDSSA